MQGSNPDGPVNYWGSYTSVASVFIIERRLKREMTVRLTTTVSNIEKAITNEEYMKIILRFLSLGLDGL